MADRLTDRLAPEVDTVYVCCLEALQTPPSMPASARPCRCKSARFRMGFNSSSRTDGAGFTPGSGEAGLGLGGIRDGVGALGGEVEITSSAGCSTAVCGTVPLLRE